MAGNYGNPYKSIRIRRGLQANLPILDDGEFGYCSDTGNLFIGFAGTNTNLTAGGGGGGGPGISFWKPNPISGFSGTPNTIDPAVGVASLSSDDWQWIFVKGQTSGGRQLVTAVPAIPAGSTVGQMIKLTGKSNTDYPVFQDQSSVSGNLMKLNGPWSGQLDQQLILSWDGVAWAEETRK